MGARSCITKASTFLAFPIQLSHSRVINCLGTNPLTPYIYLVCAWPVSVLHGFSLSIALCQVTNVGHLTLPLSDHESRDCTPVTRGLTKT